MQIEQIMKTSYAWDVLGSYTQPGETLPTLVRGRGRLRRCGCCVFSRFVLGGGSVGSTPQGCQQMNANEGFVVGIPYSNVLILVVTGKLAGGKGPRDQIISWKFGNIEKHR